MTEFDRAKEKFLDNCVTRHNHKKGTYIRDYSRLKTLEPELDKLFTMSPQADEARKKAAECEAYKLKYEKCKMVIKRFDPGIIGMYDL